jgi:hypothetical protein
MVLWVGQCPALALCARTYDATGQTLAGPLALDVPVGVLDEVPAVVALAGGPFLVAWSRPGPGAVREVVVRRFGADGGPIGPERLIAAASGQAFAAPDLAGDGAGGAVAVWERRRFDRTGDDGQPLYVGIEIQGRRLDGAGAPVGPGVWRLDGEGPDFVSAPAVAVAPGGAFLVAWQSFGFGPDGDDVLARRFALTAGGGAAPSGPEFLAHGTGTGEQTAPAVAASEQGTFLVAWQAEGAPGGASAAGQVFGPAGALWPAPFRIGSGAGGQSLPAVAGGDGAFALAWLDERHGSSVYAQLRGDGGQPLGGEVRADATDGDAPGGPAVGHLGGTGEEGGLLVAWPARAEDFSLRVLARRYPGSGTPEPCVPGETTLCLRAGGRFRVTTTWATQAGASGQGRVRPLTVDTGAFWFFKPANIEAVVKVLDACRMNQRFWVFAAGLTDVAVTLTVEDTVAGGSRTYPSPQGTAFQPVQDTAAFHCP